MALLRKPALLASAVAWAALLAFNLLILLTPPECAVPGTRGGLLRLPPLGDAHQACWQYGCAPWNDTASVAAGELLVLLREGRQPGSGGACCTRQLARLKMPRILHQIYLPDEATFLERAADPASSIRRQWAQSCRTMHAGWQHVFWGWNESVQLVGEHYPAFLPTFLGYGDRVEQADALRYLLMHKIGGLYLDLDLECFRPAEEMLEGYDVVLQGTTHEEPVTNGVLASVPGHALWEHTLHLMLERGQQQDLYILNQTGPNLFADALRSLLGHEPLPTLDLNNSLAGEHGWNATRLLVYPLGQWYTPCAWNDGACHRKLALQRAIGTAPLQLAGWHRYSATWLEEGNPEGVFSVEGVRQAMQQAQEEEEEEQQQQQLEPRTQAQRQADLTGKLRKEVDELLQQIHQKEMSMQELAGGSTGGT